MHESTKLMSFDEFRSAFEATETPLGAAAQQQREFFREPGAADELLRTGKVSAMGWPEWPSNGAVTA